MSKLYSMLFSIILMMFLVGCGGSDTSTTIQSSNTTMGQELEDLDASFKKGIITEKEYKNAKESILKRYK